MSKRPQEADVDFIRALAELLRANDLTEIEVSREYGDDDALTVTVSQPLRPGAPTAPGAGLGLLGLRERVVLLGGTLESGPGADGHWVLRARIPLGA